jgi:hypothetical protein
MHRRPPKNITGSTLAPGHVSAKQPTERISSDHSQSLSTIPTDLGSSVTLALPGPEAQRTPDPGYDIFHEILTQRIKGLTPSQKNTLLDASGSFDTVFGTISALNRQHNDQSSIRKGVDRVKPFLEVTRNYMSVVETMIQHSPDISSLVVGGLKLIVDVRVKYAMARPV